MSARSESVFYAVALSAVMGLGTVVGNPVRPGKPGVPDISGETNWGTVAQKGRQVTLLGHPNWSAAGQWRDDGKLYLVWVQLSTGQTAPALYEAKDGLVRGRWGWSGAAWVGEDGELAGLHWADEIR